MGLIAATHGRHTEPRETGDELGSRRSLLSQRTRFDTLIMATDGINPTLLTASLSRGILSRSPTRFSPGTGRERTMPWWLLHGILEAHRCERSPA